MTARYYTRMAAGPAGDRSAVRELMERAEAQGGVGPEEIADVLDCPELPIEVEPLEWTVGQA